ncbi:MFS transporter [Polymorphospora lycopeni]
MLTDWVTPASAFAVNGALYGSLLTRYPEIAGRVSASETEFGVVLFASALGGLLGSLVAPALVRSGGELGATLAAGLGYTVFAVSVAWAPELLILGAAMLVLGLLDGVHDVAMNTYAVRTQQRVGTALMGRMHATWSLSLAGAGLLGAGAAGLGVPVVVHIALVAAVALLVQLVLALRRRRYLFGSGHAAVKPEPAGPRPPRPIGAVRLRHVLPVLGLAALAASYVESPGQEWTALLLNRGFQADPGVAAIAPVLFGVGLVASRLSLDGILRRVGARTVAAVSGVVMALSMCAGLLVAAVGGPLWWALAAVAVAGLGAGPVFPLLFAAADYLSVQHGLPAAWTASIVSALSRIGAISAPVVVGPLTETFGMAMVFAVMAAGGCVVLLALPRAVR